MEGNNDRVSYSFGLKLNIGNYQSLDFHMSYSTDVKDGENEDVAMDRARKFVQRKIDEEYDAQKELIESKR